MLKKLSELGTGKSGVIKEFEDDEIFIKLMEMGCVLGESVTVEHRAPLGDPISVFVSGYKLSLRINEAEKIWVEEINN